MIGDILSLGLTLKSLSHHFEHEEDTIPNDCEVSTWPPVATGVAEATMDTLPDEPVWHAGNPNPFAPSIAKAQQNTQPDCSINRASRIMAAGIIAFIVVGTVWALRKLL